MPVVHPYHRSELLDISLRIVGTVLKNHGGSNFALDIEYQ